MKRSSYSPASLITTTLAACLVMVATPIAYGQPTGMSVKPLLRTGLSDDATKESIMLAVEFAPGGTTGRHTHHGDEYAFVLEGALELHAEGRETRKVTAGEAFHNPRGLVHEARNVGDTPARLHITFIVDKGKPIVEPVSK